MKEPTAIAAHLLVCRGPDCMSRGAQAVYTELAGEINAAGLDDVVTQSQCGCIGPLCGSGPVVCAYPTGTWYAPVAPEDCADIVSNDLARGTPVGRLAVAHVRARPGERGVS